MNDTKTLNLENEVREPGGALAHLEDASKETGAHWRKGTAAPWYSGWDLSEEERARYRELSRDSHARARSNRRGSHQYRPCPISRL